MAKKNEDSKTVYINVHDEAISHEWIDRKAAEKTKKKRSKYEFGAGDEWCVLDEKYIYKTRIFDREHDNYYEDVVDPETGEIIHHCEEPLSKHFGHGSDKEKKS